MRRIAELIQRSNKSLKKIAEQSEIPFPRLLEIVEDKEPTLAELRKLASTLKLELSDFNEPSTSHSRTVVLFRQTMGDKLKASSLPAVEKLSTQLEQSLELLSEDYPTPNWLKPFRVTKHDYPTAQRLAKQFRELFFNSDHFSPIYDLPKIAVELLEVILLITPNLKIDGASALVNGSAFVFISPRFPPRMLFTLAHELGHLITHHQSNETFAIFDEEESTGHFLRGGVQERFVDAFASCLLLPSRGVGIALRKIRDWLGAKGDYIGDVELLYLSHFFGVSFQVAAKRCEDIGLMPKGSTVSLYEKLRREHGSPEKRAKELNLPPLPEINFPTVPTKLLESAAQKIRRGDVSIGKAAQTLKITIPTLIEEYSRTLAG